MKKIHLIIAVLASFIFLCSSCKKYIVKPAEQLSLLPPATQTGARTFGCLVNGTAFVPKNRSIFEGPILEAYIGNGVTVGGGNPGSSTNGSAPVTPTNIMMQADSMQVSAGQTIPLTAYNTPGMAYGAVISPPNDYYYTNAGATGQLHITRLDGGVISGTFYFTAVNKAGDTIKVTDGRFDLLVN